MLQSLVGVLSPALSRFAARQYGRRGAEAGPPSGLTDLGPELDEALDVLAGGEGLGRVTTGVKAALSERPSAFSQPMVQRWVGHPRARASLKEAVRRASQDLGYDAQKAACLAVYAEVTGERPRSGARYFEDALTFLRRTARTHVSPEARALLENANANRETILAGLAPISEQIATLPALLDLGSTEALDAFITSTLERVSRCRCFAEAQTYRDLDRLASEVKGGGLRRADVRLRGAVLREAAAEAARGEMVALARDHLAAAKGLAPSVDYGVDDARLALCEGDACAAMRLLRDRTDPVSLSMVLDAVHVRDGAEASVRHFEAHLRDPAVLTGAGLARLAQRLFELGRVGDAYAVLRRADSRQIEDYGALLHVRMRVAVALCLPEETRRGFELDAWALPRAVALRDDAQGREWLAAGLADAQALAVLVGRLDLPTTALHCARDAAWLGLAFREGPERVSAEARLRSMLQDRDAVFAAVPLACEFEIPFDRAAVEGRLGEAAALGGWTADQCASALHLAFENPRSMASLIEAKRSALAQVIDASYLDALLVEALVKCGEVDRARTAYDAALARDPEGAASILRGVEPILLAAEGGDATALQVAAYEDGRELTALVGLVELLRDVGDAERLARYLPDLWRRRRRVVDAREACAAFTEVGDEDGKAAFLRELGPVADGDPELLMHKAWSASRAGDFAEARSALRVLAQGGDDANARALRINIGMETGDWDDLHAVLAKDLDAPGGRRARDLMQAANIGQAIGSRRVAALVEAAVAAAPDDPHILLGAYLSTVRSGREVDHSNAAAWLHRAAELSGPDGPVQERNAADLPEIMRERRDRARDMSAMVVGGDVPLSLGIGPLDLPPTEVFTELMPANAGREARHRVALPFFNGQRTPTDLREVEGIGLDLGALLLQARLGILETVIGAFPSVVIPAGTLPSLLRDLGAVRMHQPSRAAEAALISAEVERGGISALEIGPANPSLVESVGPVFAQIVSAAERTGGLILHTPPVRREGSFDMTAVGIGPLEGMLVDLPTLVSALAEEGALDEAGENRALEDLASRNAVGRWDAGAKLTGGHPLIVDSLALHFLAAAGLLATVTRHFGSILVHPRTLEEVRGSLSASGRGERLADAVEAIRVVLHRSISAGLIRIGVRRDASTGRRRGRASPDAEILPLESLITDPGPVDAIVVDDRFINAYGTATDRSGRSRPVGTTLDVIDALVARGVIDSSRRRALRYEMRRSGVVLMPVDAEEIVAAALRGNPCTGPSAELQAIAESIVLPFLRDAVRLPRDATWFMGTVAAALEAIKRVWVSASDVTLAACAADRILEFLPRPAEWVAIHDEAGREAWRGQVELMINGFLTGGLAGGDAKRGTAYAEWAEARVAAPMKARDPAAFGRLVEYRKELLLGHLARRVRRSSDA